MRTARRTLRSAVGVALAAAALVPQGAAAAGNDELGAGPSCETSCITTALVEPHTQAFGVTVRTDTPARILIGVSELLADEGAWIDHELSQPGTTRWGNHLTGLEPDTLYKVTVRATDALSHTESHTTFVRTLPFETAVPEGPDGVQSNVGCSQQCIAEARLAPAATGAELTVETTVPTKLTVSVDDDAPGTIGDAPVLGTPESTFSTSQYATRSSGVLDGLAPATLHHIVVRATDAAGRFSFQQGVFRTETRRAKLVLDGIRVYYDGDKGGNRGELAFRTAVNQVHQPGQKMKERTVASGNWLDFPSSGRDSGPIHLTPLSRGLNVAIQARERDHAPTCSDDRGSGMWTPDSGKTDEWCEKWTWVTARGVIDLDAPVGDDASPLDGGTGRHDIEFRTSWSAGIRFVVHGHVNVRYE